MKRVLIATDGSASVKAGNGGWAFCALADGRRTERYGCGPLLKGERPTVNVMELTAIGRALQSVRGVSELVIQSDSEYAVRALTVHIYRWQREGWLTGDGKPVANRKLIEAVRALIETHEATGCRVTVQHIRGHNGHEGNERADFLAGQARTRQVTNWRRSCVLTKANTIHRHEETIRTHVQRRDARASSREV